MSGPHALLRSLLRADAGQASAPAAVAADWEALVATAPRDLLPYLSWQLTHLGDAAEPPAVARRALDAARRNAALAHLPRQALFRRIAATLDGGGFPFVVLKGMALAHLAYPDPALRPMGDIDIWVHRDHLEPAALALHAAGIPYSARMEARRAAADPLDHAVVRVFEVPGTPVALELHGVVRSMRDIAPGWGARAWARSTPRDLGGVVARVPHTEDMVDHLAIHASAHHRFEMGLRPLLDLTLWLAREGAGCDWTALTARWRAEGCHTWTVLTLALARELLGARVPDLAIREAIQAPGLDELLALARTQVLEADRTLPPTLAKLATTPTTGGRGRWLLHRLTTWYWKGPPGQRRGILEAVRSATSRMASDLRTKLPAYVRGWRDGSLRGEEFQRRQALAAGRLRLAELVARVEGPPAPGPGQ